ncbi:MAG: PASTA domain-containing protein [Bacteroidetes bacterium]|nr:MAG: PASTA domain-containing protein [Bacteroidota bacterium]
MSKSGERIKRFWQEFKGFVTSLFFLKHFAAIIGTLLLFFFMTNTWLRCYTRHGEVIKLDQFEGKTLAEAKKNSAKNHFKFVVLDSIWYPDKKPGTIMTQDPPPGSPVKEGRSVYITISKFTPDAVELPPLSESGYNYNRYSSKLKRKDIHSVVKEEIYDARQDNNTIAWFYYKGNKVTDADVKEGFKVNRGDTLYFVVTRRTSQRVNIPNLVCLQYDAAEFLLTGSDLAVGEIFMDETVIDQASAYVWKQRPAFLSGRVVPKGTQIDLYLTQDLPAGCQ